MSQAIYACSTDGSSFIHEGAQRAGYGIVSDTEVVKAWAFPVHNTNQQAELTALTFQLGQEQSLNIYIDFTYAFHILLYHVAIWSEHEILTTKGGSITNADQIMALLKASISP